MKVDIVIVGAGAAGLMAARELGKAGKKVIILEARNRIGGRIMPLSEEEFGYPAQGGAEFVHGEAPVTKALIKEAGLTYVPEEGEVWSVRDGDLSLNNGFFQPNEKLKEKLSLLKEDISIADFLDQNLTEDEDISIKNSIIKIVEGYDAADPKLISTFSLRNEWLSESEWNDGKIKEGYGALINFLEEECMKNGVEIHLNTVVKSIGLQASSVQVGVNSNEIYEASKVIVTVPLPTIKDIQFNPEVQNIKAASKIGFGNAIKLIIKFKTRWWENMNGMDLSKMNFLLCNEKFMTWWTQYPEINSTIVGWMAGPSADKYKSTSDQELLDIALTSLSNIFKIDKAKLLDEIAVSKVVNWPNDPYTKGAYSYSTYYTQNAYKELAEPYDNAIFFAGEALGPGTETAIVEGALASGLDVSNKILGK